jgi:hypothetical protein
MPCLLGCELRHLLALEMLLQQKPVQAAHCRARTPFGVQLGFEWLSELNQHSDHFHMSYLRYICNVPCNATYSIKCYLPTPVLLCYTMPSCRLCLTLFN